MISTVGMIAVAGICWTSGKEGWAVFVVGLWLALNVLPRMLLG